jgi:two-component system, OmpR family, alkaline phosphatase synthesis response regulator PhoP
MKAKILFVEDEQNLLNSVSYILQREGFSVIGTATGEEGVALAKKELPDLVLLDLNLPGIDGYEVCRLLKKDRATADIFIIMFTGRGTDEEVVAGLASFADDYIVKPYQPRVLIARIEALLRRHRRPGDERPEVITSGALSIDPAARTVLLGNASVKLTKTEFDILLLLSRHPNQVFTRDRIIDEIRGNDYSITERVVDYQVAGLRKKLGAAASCIETIRGLGYKFTAGAVPC